MTIATPKPALRPVPRSAREVRRRFNGRLYLPGDPGYDGERLPLDPAVDPRPAVIAEASGTEDVQAAVQVAREHGLRIGVQATGHGTHEPLDGGILLKTSRMRGVLVDPERRVARVSAGARWEDVLAAAAPFGLAPLSGSAASVGVAGFTLGGGVGWLSRKHGFAADSVLAAELVDADGRRHAVSAESHPDLFWAIRGGGGSFGIVTALEFRLYPVSRVYAGTSLFSADRAGALLRTYREWIAEAPDELSTAVLITRAPDTPELPASLRGRRVAAIRAMHLGEPAAAEEHLRPLRAAAGVVLHEGLRPVGFARAGMGGTPPRQLELLRDLPYAAVEAAIAATESDDSPVQTIELRHWGGAMARADATSGPVGHRGVPLSLIADAHDPHLAGALAPHATGGSFLNFLRDTTRTETAFTLANLRRLIEVKTAYDPANFFSHNHNIAPRPRG